MKFPESRSLIRITFVILWVVLFGMLLKRDYFIKTLDLRESQVIQKSREESFNGVYFRQERIGFVKTRLTPVDDGFELSQKALLQLNILEQRHRVELDVTARLVPDMLLKDFDFRLQSPFYRMTASGYVEGRTVHFTLMTGKEQIRDSITLEKPPFLATNQRSYLIEQKLEPGEKIRIPYFDPISLSGKDTVLEYKGYEKILLKGRVHRLHHFTESFSGMKINSWLDSTGKVIKEESPSGFTFISEPEFKATDIPTSGDEILSSVSVPVKGVMPDNFAARSALTYRISYPAEAEVEINRDRQKTHNDTLSVILEKLPTRNAQACAGPDEELSATPYIQSESLEISGLIDDLLKSEMGDFEKVKIMAGWVFDTLEKRPVLGIPDALTTLRTKMGDCNEHAALFAAMARNAKIPTRIVAGVTYHQNSFYYHAWNEVCLDDQWLSLDTTKNQIPADVTHIKFVEGETKEQIRIGGLLGRLHIEVLPAEENVKETEDHDNK